MSRSMKPGDQVDFTCSLEADLARLEAAPIRQSLKAEKRYSGLSDLGGDNKICEDDCLLPQSDDGFHCHLDATRIVCVFCVAIDHYNSTFGENNVLFTQHWVLQYLVLVSGICFALSNRSLMMFQCRLAVYLLIGVSLNLVAWIVMSLPWQKDMFNVIFQCWFIVGLMCFSFLFAPLRHYLRYVLRCEARGERRILEPPFRVFGPGVDESVWNFLVLGGGFIALIAAFEYVLHPALEGLEPAILRLFHDFGMTTKTWSFPTTVREAQQFVHSACTFTFLSCSNLYFVVVLPMFFKHLSLIPWAVLINTYAHRAYFYRAEYERLWHIADLFMIAQVCYFFGLRNRKKIGAYVVRYWFVVLFFAALLWDPTTHERLDMSSPKDVLVRARNAAAEFLFVAVWLVAGERLVRPEIFTEDRLGFLNEWALAVFLVHKAAFIVVPGPWAWAALMALIPVIYAVHKSCQLLKT
eukprot:TRINITY_DN2855_c0_g2_i2.p1 TRINITY_DN2855_c0_g2~~TRINITY_DN2855_c0_g2_i2.p1  ORF type:complete len:466 (+),score=69.91 TRINITY_DN2855_c0_g2_i2:194-1591(+)